MGELPSNASLPVRPTAEKGYGTVVPAVSRKRLLLFKDGYLSFPLPLASYGRSLLQEYEP